MTIIPRTPVLNLVTEIVITNSCLISKVVYIDITDIIYYGNTVYYSPVAVPSVLNTCTVISVDDGLLRTSTCCAGPASSS